MNQKQIKEQIDAIFDKRHKERLPKVEESIEFHKELLEKVEEMDFIIHEVKRQLAVGSGRYHDMLNNHNGLEQLLFSIDLNALHQKLSDQLETLNHLKKRFSRTEIHIGVIGYAKQGKRTLIKSISGLRGDLIPFHNGLDCHIGTYAIHNRTKPFLSRITYMNMSEFLSMCGRNLALFFPENTFQIRSIKDLTSLDLADRKTNDWRVESIYQEFISTIIGHIPEIVTLIGISAIETSDENIVMDNVAKSRLYSAIPEEENADQFTPIWTIEGRQWEKRLFKHGIVKDVQIYTSFPAIDDFKVCLIDTESLLSPIAGILKEEMFRFLEEDCDAAIITFRPSMNGGGFSTDHYQILRDIAHRLHTLQPGEWIFNAIEKVSVGGRNNHWNVAEVIHIFNELLKISPVKPFADTIGVDFSNPIEVSENLTIPLLETLARNLDDIDSKYASNIKYTNEELYLEYKKIAETVINLLGNRELSESHQYNPT